jgi:hypothetical protein
MEDGETATEPLAADTLQLELTGNGFITDPRADP